MTIFYKQKLRLNVDYPYKQSKKLCNNVLYEVVCEKWQCGLGTILVAVYDAISCRIFIRIKLTH